MTAKLVGGCALFLAGMTVGWLGGMSDTPDQPPATERPAPIVKTVTKTVTVEGEMPKSCLSAIALFDTITSYDSQLNGGYGGLLTLADNGARTLGEGSIQDVNEVISGIRATKDEVAAASIARQQAIANMKKYLDQCKKDAD